jgi:hypothetical protein
MTAPPSVFITQQYSSATFALLRLHSSKEKKSALV